MTAEQVQALTTETLVAHLPLGLDGYRSTDADLFNVLVGAAAQQRSSESACAHLVDAPSANRVRQMLTDRLLEEVAWDDLDAEGNRVLVARLPVGVRHRPVPLAIDLTLRPD